MPPFSFDTSFKAAWHRQYKGLDQSAGDTPPAQFQRVTESIPLIFSP
jgi:hypothetical protein